ncbi:epilancin biosynthesis-related protein ElxI1 [Staphylococcus condimenti]|uniref:epilancin biosynthesis-related protein ElxI1 n=1 Tax=Staphylococcus condimenti TaxID=70255 RepID=UPI0036F27797
MTLKIITKILDGLAFICVALLFLKYAVKSANMMFDWHLRWYFLEDIPHMGIILFILMFVFAVPSEMIKDKHKEKTGHDLD